tara:strand:+ start:6 stop:875 length:870 start_codon:yes stop_codon:yes gene_type:complete
MKFEENLSKINKIIFKVAQPVLKSVLKLKNIHQGESCYIIGDGISIKWFDLSIFSNKPVISLNKIAYHKQSSYLNLKYTTFTEPYYFYPYYWDPDPGMVETTGKQIFKNYVQKKFKELIKKQRNTTFFVNLSNYPTLWDPNICWVYKMINDPNSKFLQECNYSNLNIYAGSFRCAVALAVYMGFSEIFLVGCDYTHEKPKAQRWYEKGTGILKNFPEYEKDFLNIARKYANITTITLEGGGTHLPGQTYYQFSGKEPKFRENIDLMEKSMLDTLSKEPWYSNRKYNRIY